ncbi:hypothetical protein B7P34_19590 [Streptosporangium nondiastaticum]|uniref:Integral membrane protein n=1 Tax=Streptosporangium nondiastaticum TaxID=35764 RepID=A0A9X7JNV6_9ACTN|nr:hypothetical protein [Streptosporangium nondiastaticum]PSJ27072.1 hypothetical protein B7P34_19590 [Streptosporangium nondiastaticum]
MMARDHELKKDLAATLETRKELGPEYEAELVDAFLEKVDRKLEAAIDRRVRRQAAETQMAVARGDRPRTGGPGAGSFGERFGFAVASLVLAVPLSAIAVVNAHLPGLLVSWAGIVGVNAVNAAGVFPWQRGRQKREDGASGWE